MAARGTPSSATENIEVVNIADETAKAQNHDNVADCLEMASLEEETSKPAQTPNHDVYDENEDQNIDRLLDAGDINDIRDVITPLTLGSCRTNCLEKAMEVGFRLNERANESKPDAEDYQELAETTQEFACQLLDPLKNDPLKQAIFGGKDFDRVLDKVVEYEQKKFVAHPVVYSMLMQRWAGDFYCLRESSLPFRQRLKLWLINIWTTVDTFLFPIMIMSLFIIHLIVRCVKHIRGYQVVILWNISEATESLGNLTDLTAKIKNSLKGCHIIEEETTGFIFSSSSEKPLQKATENERKRKISCVIQNVVDSVFVPRIGNPKKVIIVFTDKKFGDPEEFSSVSKILRSKGIAAVSIGLGTNIDVKELEAIATEPGNVIKQLVVMADSKDTCSRIVERIRGTDIFDHYVKYFTTPYFVFFRDICSNVLLLVLHMYVCFMPTGHKFIPQEWGIFFIFLGRFMMETHQIFKLMKLNQGKNSCWNWFKRTLAAAGSHSRDIWNRLNLVTLAVYAISLILMIASRFSRLDKKRPSPYLALSDSLYGLNAMLITLGVFGHIMESRKKTGAIQIALVKIISVVGGVLGQLIAAVIAFSLVITKVFMVNIYVTGHVPKNAFCKYTITNCWWHTYRQLVWSLVGNVELEWLDWSSTAAATIAKVLYFAFLLMSVLILLNMLIALLSNTYQHVEDNSFYEWSYKKAMTIRTYSNYHPVPIPFNIISLAALLVWSLCKGIRSRLSRAQSTYIEVPPRAQEHPANRGRGHSFSADNGKIFNDLCKELLSSYYAVNGDEFAITEEKKINRLLKETKENNQLMTDIVNRVFKEGGDEKDLEHPTDSKIISAARSSASPREEQNSRTEEVLKELLKKTDVLMRQQERLSDEVAFLSTIIRPRQRETEN